MRLLIDTDPGFDDGVALTLALRHPAARVEAITVVTGNAGLEQTVRNARLVVETCGVSVPVYAGAGSPLVRPAPARPAWIHGTDGFGDLGLHPARGEADHGFAPDRIVELVMTHPGEITIVTLGPLTNLALALAREPHLAAAVREVVVMGGVLGPGNVTPVAEFNIHADPEAARLVLNAGLPLTLVPFDLCRGPARLTVEDVSAITAPATAPVILVRALLHHGLDVAARRPALLGESGATCPDAVAMAVALDRTLLTETMTAYVDVETRGELTSGMTVVDRLGVLGKEPNAAVGVAVDAAGFKAGLMQVLARE